MQLGRRGSEAKGGSLCLLSPAGHCQDPEQTAPPCLGLKEVVANSSSTMVPGDSLLDVTLLATPTLQTRLSKTIDFLKDPQLGNWRAVLPDQRQARSVSLPTTPLCGFFQSVPSTSFPDPSPPPLPTHHLLHSLGPVAAQIPLQPDWVPKTERR